MFTRVMAHVASLAERSKVARPVVARVMIQVGAGQYHARSTEHGRCADPDKPGLHALQRHRREQASYPPSLPVSPAYRILVPPLAVAEMNHIAAVGTPAMLAASPRAGEPDMVRQLAPVDWV